MVKEFRSCLEGKGVRRMKKKILWMVSGIALSILFFSYLGWATTTYEAGQTPWNLTETMNILENYPTWSPDSSKLAYFALTKDPDKCNVYCVSKANTTSPGTPVLVSTGSIQDIVNSEEGLTFNKAGDKLIFCAGPVGEVEIWIANADGSGSPTQLLAAADIDYLATSVSWHDPNNKEWLIYLKDEAVDDKLVVRELHADTNSVGDTEITIVQLSDADFPKWSYQGDKITLMKTYYEDIDPAKYERADVYVLTGVQDIIAAEGATAPTSWADGRFIQITKVMAAEAEGWPVKTEAQMPAFSYDGSKVFYTLDLGGNFRTDQIDYGDANYDPLHAYNRNEIDNNTDDSTVEFDIYIAAADGSDGLTDGTGDAVKFDDQYYNQAYLAMSPDGMWLSYMDDRLQAGAGDIFIVPIKSTTSCGAAGGTADSLDYSQVEVPAGAVSSATEFTIYKPKLSATQESGTPFCARKFGPAGTDFGDNPVNITIHYTDKELGSYSEDGLYIVKWSDLTSKWERVSGTITRDKTNNKITIPVSSFSIYGVEGSAAAKDDDDKWYKCAIATAAYGTPMAEEVKALSTFRDEYLLTNKPGQTLVSTYERISPPIADFIRDKEPLKAMVRAGLKPLVWVAEKATQ